MTSVTTNGSWVTMMVKISAGSSGPRRTQLSLLALRFASRTCGCTVGVDAGRVWFGGDGHV